MADESGERKGFWGSTLSKLKTALSKTKTQITGAVEEETAADLPPSQTSTEPPVYQSNTSQDPAKVEADDSGYPARMQSAENESESGVGNPGSVHTTAVTSVQEAPPVVPRSESPSGSSATIAIDEEYLEDLEEKLIKADIGLTNVQEMITHLRKESRGKAWNRKDVVQFLKSEFQNILKAAPSAELKNTPGTVNIYLIVGVNGVGKTTSIGKVAWRFKQEGKKVLLAAGDTFRAAAESQLEIWSERSGVDIVRLGDNADPGAVVFTAIDKAKKENYDCLLIDTAGRLHNKSNLMAELSKIRGVVEKHGKDLPLECLLVLDASTGQNGLQQAKLFTEVCKLTGVILTKLDGTAKGGVVFSIAKDLKIPVKLIGLGEKIDELRDFEPNLFVEALF
jgi:fused signal recognition particle receptor